MTITYVEDMLPKLFKSYRSGKSLRTFLESVTEFCAESEFQMDMEANNEIICSINGCKEKFSELDNLWSHRYSHADDLEKIN